MSSRNNRARAHEALVGGSLSDTVTLPTYVHERAMKAVKGTVHDSRERSIHFAHRRDRWSGGLALRGKPASPTGARTNRAHAIIASVTSPVLTMHTHPSINENHVLDSVAYANWHGARNDTELAIYTARELQLRRAVFMLPSTPDIRNMLANQMSSIGHMVSSEGGHFLAISNDQYGVKRNSPLSSLDYFERDELIRQHVSPIKSYIEIVYREYRTKAEMDARNVYAAQRSVIAGTLAAGYACYFTPDIENPSLERIPVSGILSNSKCSLLSGGFDDSGEGCRLVDG
ncbi:MAG: hypothetical protein JWO35_540 [Candidatus Saccharibacteria bacterium]|nr:hypothetical protein [Candidatus Saccharibacteria bacterium]